MSEFDSLAEELVEEARNEEARQQQRDLSLIGKSLKSMIRSLLPNFCVSWEIQTGPGETLNRWINGKCGPRSLTVTEASLERLLPQPPANHPNYAFRFIDLFAGIGGIRHGFEAIGGQCVFTSEWNSYSVKTYKANWYCDPEAHIFNSDIRDVTLSHKEDVSEEDAYAHIDKSIPDHDVLLAGFPCQPFSLAGVSKKTHLAVNTVLNVTPRGPYSLMWLVSSWQKPAIFVLENVKNLKSHDKGKTFRVIMDTLNELGYDVADAEATGADDPKVIDGKHFIPQHRERIVLVGFRRDLNLSQGFSLADISSLFPERKVLFRELLDSDVDDKYTLTPKLWDYLYKYAKNTKRKVMALALAWLNQTMIKRFPEQYQQGITKMAVNRLLIVVGIANSVKNFNDPDNMARRPRRLTPRECARLMDLSSRGK